LTVLATVRDFESQHKKNAGTYFCRDHSHSARPSLTMRVRPTSCKCGHTSPSVRRRRSSSR
ncbi:hypothetical protein HaLaN_07802, partial [Haematococcus lacustris]